MLIIELTPPGFCTLASLNPNLTSLRLDYCGYLDNTVVSAWSNCLPHLKRLELLGPFLVRTEAWQSFFKSRTGLEGFLITQSPRFDLECLEALKESCDGRLKELRLKEVGKLGDDFVDVLKEFTGLRYLDLGDPSRSISEESGVELLGAIGSELTYLDMSGHTSLGDAFLVDGIGPHSPALSTLVMRNAPELTDEGVAEFFNTWSDHAPLTHLDLSRNHMLSCNALSALIAQSGKGLQSLNINGWKTVSEASLLEITKRAKDLRTLDVGWCREVDNFMVRDLLQACEDLKEVKVWGCNRLTENCPRKVRLIVFLEDCLTNSGCIICREM